MNKQEIEKVIAYWKEFKSEIPGLKVTCQFPGLDLDEQEKFTDLAISALEKQIPKKAYHFLDNDTFITTCCDYDVTNEDCDYCPNCGQLLGDVEEVEG